MSPKTSLLVFALLLIIAAGATSLTSCVSSTDKQAEKTWAGEMQGMATNVRKLVPFLYDRHKFYDPKNRVIISHELKEFASSSHKISPEMGKKILGDDPLVAFSLGHLHADLQRASHAFDAGQFEYARGVAKASLSHCFRCHSLTQMGSKAGWDLRGFKNLSLQPLEKIDLLVAARKYDDALSYMEGLIDSDSFIKDHPFDYEALLRRYLAVTVRATAAPDRALIELDRVSETKGVPRYILEQVQGWRRSLNSWVREMKHHHRRKDLIQRARKRIERAMQIQHFPQDHAGDVEYLRATTLLHEALKRHLKPTKQAETLYLLGRAYEVLDDLGSWNLHESYYEVCIRKAPKSAWAKSCYTRLEASIYQGYSGSSGTHLPAHERQRLKELREML